MEYVKVKKEKGEGMSNYGAQINCETMCGPDLSIENNNLSIESHPSQSAALSATNDPVDYDEVGVVRDRDDQNHSRYNSFVISLEESQAKCVQYEIESDSSSDRGARDESDYDDRSSRLKRVEVRLRRVDVDNPVDRDDHDHDDLANLLARMKRVEVRLKRVDIDTSPDRPKRLRKPNKKYSSTEYDLSGLDGGIEQVDDVYVVWTFPSFYDEVGTEYDLSLVE